MLQNKAYKDAYRKAHKDQINAYQRAYFLRRRKKKKLPVPFTPGTMAWEPRILMHDEWYDTIHEHRALIGGMEMSVTNSGIFNIPSSDDDFMVAYSFSESVPGTRDEPPEGEEVEIISVRLILADNTLGPDILDDLDPNDKASLEEQISEKEGDDEPSDEEYQDEEDDFFDDDDEDTDGYDDD